MNAPYSAARAYRLFGILALFHFSTVVGLWLIPISDDWFLRLQLGLTALAFFWPLVLLLHSGRSVRRLISFGLPVGILLVPCFLALNRFGPFVLGLPIAVDLTPSSVWSYVSSYRAGRAEAEKDVAAGRLAVEVYGFGAGGGHYTRLVKDRYQIDIRPVADCFVNERIAGHAAGYNSVSEPEIERRVSRASLDAAQEEGARLDAEEHARRQQREQELTKRLTSLPAESKVIATSIWIAGDQPILEENLSDEEIKRFIHAIEEFVARAVPVDAAAAEFRVGGDLTATGRPSFQTSSSFSLTRPVYDKIRTDLEQLPDVRPRKERVPYHVTFEIRGTPVSKPDPSREWNGSETAAAIELRPAADHQQ